MTIQQNFGFRPHVETEFSSTGVFGPNPLVTNLMANFRVAVENVGLSNVILVRGRLDGQSAWTTLSTITGPTAGTTVDISTVDEIQLECTVYDASGGTPKLIASGFFKPTTSGGGSTAWGAITGTLSDQTDLQNALDTKEDVANKVTDFSIVDQTLYPSVEAVDDQIEATLEGSGSYYFTNTAHSTGGGRLEMVLDTIPIGGGVGLISSAVVDTDILQTWASVAGVPGITFLPPGYMAFEVQARQSGGTKTSKLYAEFYRRDLGGTEFLLATTPLSVELTSTNQTINAYVPTGVLTGFATTDILLIKIRASITGAGTDPEITLDIQGINYSRAKFPQIISVDLSSKQDVITGTNTYVVYKNNSGIVETNPQWYFEPVNQGLRGFSTIEPNGGSGFEYFNRTDVSIDPVSSSPNETWTIKETLVEIDSNADGFSLGTAGQAVYVLSNNIFHDGQSDTGQLSFLTNNFTLGNGTDPIDVDGISYLLGFGTLNANVTVTNNIQGYGFQPNANSSATIHPSAFVQAFYDGADFNCASPSYQSFNASPQLSELTANAFYTGLTVNPTISSFNGNAGAAGIGIYGNYSGFVNGGFQGIIINPTATGVNFANGLSINMSSVTGSNIKAMDITGDVSINGSLSFTGSLSLGKVDAFYASNPIDGGGNPQTLHSLVTSMTALDSVTVANADAIGVNTAMLITLEDDSVTTSGPFQLGLCSLTLPCVVETHVNATLDYMSCVTGAVNLSGASTGGTIDEIRVMRGVVVPNGITTINKLKGYHYHEPFGGIATDSWGLYIEDAQKNYIESPLKVGASDTPDSGFMLHVEGDTKLEGDLAHLSGDVGFYGVTPIAQPASSGAATAGGTWTATEQAMLQEAYNALRALGLMS